MTMVTYYVGYVPWYVLEVL